MKQTLQTLLRRYREQWSYLIVGGCTTLVNYAVFFLLDRTGLYYQLSNVLAWVCAVIFAYFANGRWVYKSVARRGWREAGSFALSRLFSLGLESLLLYLLVDLAQVHQLAAKLLVAVVVVVVNYITGRIVYLRKGA